MFGLSFITLFTVLTWLAALIVLLKVGRGGWLEGLKLRLVTGLGALLVVTAFFFQPWLQFNFLDYIFSSPQLLKDVFSDETIAWLAQQVGLGGVGKAIGMFSSITNVTGLGLELMPTLGGWSRFWLTAPVVLAILAGVGAPLGAYLRGTAFSKCAGGILMGCGTILLIGLAFSLPDLDALGIHDRFDLMLITAIMGAQLGNGPGLTLVGLLLLLAGGVVEWQDRPSHNTDRLPEVLL